MKQVYIYALKDPETQEVRYVGKTVSKTRRLYNHIFEAKSGKSKRRSLNWIRSLLDKDLKPIMDVLEICSEQTWEEREKYWIAQFPKDRLCNHESGGLRGSVGRKHIKLSDQSIDKIRNMFSSFTHEERVNIWKDIEKGKTLKELQIIYPKITRNIFFQVKSGRCWNNITKLPLVKPSKPKNIKDSGKGYDFSKSDKKWRVRKRIDGKVKVLGYFNTENEAIQFLKNRK